MSHFDVNSWKDRSRLALLIGINEYNGANLKPIRGAVNDVHCLAKLLRDKFSFGVNCLVDQAATRQGILGAMKALLEIAKDGDQIVFAWSGLGSRISLEDGRSLETLVSADSSRISWDYNHDIADREVFGWVCQITLKTPFLTLIIDACRSGGIVGAPLRVNPKGALARAKSAFLPDSFQTKDWNSELKMALVNRYTLLASCASHEYCREFEEPHTGMKRGLFSYWLEAALSRTTDNQTWRELFEEVEVGVSRHSPLQHPQLEGNVDRVIFGDDEFRPDFFISVLDRDAQKLTLGGGCAHGIQHGSLWAVAPAHSRQLGETVLGVVKIEDLGATVAVGTIVHEAVPAAIGPGCRAFEVSRPNQFRLRVQLDSMAREDSELFLNLRKSALLHIADEGSSCADVFLHRLPVRRFCRSLDPLPQIPRLDREVWAFLDRSGRQVAPLQAAAADGSRQEVCFILEKLARHRCMAQMEHPNPELSVTRTLEIDVFEVMEDGSESLLSNLEAPILQPGARVAFCLTHRHSEPLQVTIIGLGFSGGIRVIYPVRGRFEPWSGEKPLRIGFESVDAIDLRLPDRYPFEGEPPFGEGKNSLIFLFTETSVRNLDLLEQQELSSGISRRPSGAEETARLNLGGAPQGMSLVGALKAPERWGLFRWGFLLRA